MADRLEHDESNHRKPTSFDDPSNSPFPRYSAKEIASMNAHQLTTDVGEMRKGSAAASEHALSEVRQMAQGGYLKEMAKDLEQSGGAKVTYGPGGEVQHIVFKGQGTDAPVDIDVQKGTVNRESPEQLRQKSVKQAEDYLGAEFKDTRITDSNGKPFPPEIQDDAKKLINSLLEIDLPGMTEAAQKIMRNPEEAKKVQEILDHITFPSQFNFDQDEKGKPRLTVEGTPFQAVVIPAQGQAQGVKTDFMGRPTSEPTDLKNAFNLKRK